MMCNTRKGPYVISRQVLSELGLTVVGQNDYCNTITIAKSTVAILLLLQVPIAILLR